MDYTTDPRYKGILDKVKELGLTGHPRFYELLALEAVTHADKNHDYAGDEDPLANFKECQVYGIDPLDGIITRITDKDMRFRNWYKKRHLANNPLRQDVFALKVSDESILDTLTDRSVYTKLLRILLEERQVS